MLRTIKTLALSAMIGLGGLAAIPATAQAEGLYLHLGNADARLGVYVGDRGRDHHRWDRRSHRDDRRCSPREAVNKAERLGLRRVEVRNVTPSRIVVTGRDRGDRVAVTFGRGRNCPIIRY